MGLLDKIKDLFMDDVTEDEEMEVLEEQTEQYNEPKYELPKVMRDTIDKEEKIELKVKPEEFVQKEKNEPEKANDVGKKFNFPIDFEEELPSRNSNQKSQNVLKLEKEKEREKEVTKRVSELYPKKEEVKEKPKFKATPVISPVYGILDKNYKKEEVKEKAEDTVEMKRPSKKVDFETVRKKAFGNLVDEIKDNLMCENCELYREVKKISSLKEDDLLYDMTVDNKEEVTIEKAYDDYEEFGVAYEPKNTNNHDEEVVDNVQINNNQIEENSEEDRNSIDFEKLDQMIDEPEKEEVPEEDIPSRSGKRDEKKDTKVDEDFFELIDSMYKERVDD